MRIKFKLRIGKGLFKKDEVQIVEGLLIGCSEDNYSAKIRVWYDNKVTKVNDEDVVDVIEHDAFCEDSEVKKDE